MGPQYWISSERLLRQRQGRALLQKVHSKLKRTPARSSLTGPTFRSKPVTSGRPAVPVLRRLPASLLAAYRLHRGRQVVVFRQPSVTNATETPASRPALPPATRNPLMHRMQAPHQRGRQGRAETPASLPATRNPPTPQKQARHRRVRQGRAEKPASLPKTPNRQTRRKQARHRRIQRGRKVFMLLPPATPTAPAKAEWAVHRSFWMSTAMA
jgi:hypothetical protein